MRLRIASYNIHKCVGMDRRHLPSRIAAVINELAADIVGLQEVLSIPGSRPEHDQAGFLAARCGAAHVYAGETEQRHGGSYGNLLLSRFPIHHAESHDLSVALRERRGCIQADVVLPNRAVLHVFSLHLGTSRRERNLQGAALTSERVLGRPDLRGPRVVLGDFNEWIPGVATTLLRQQMQCVHMHSVLAARPSYPGLFPLLHLDNIYYDGRLRLVAHHVHRSRQALVASDHLPVVADFELLPD